MRVRIQIYGTLSEPLTSESPINSLIHTPAHFLIMSDFEKKDSLDIPGGVAVSAVSAHDAGVTEEGMALANDPHR